MLGLRRSLPGLRTHPIHSRPTSMMKKRLVAVGSQGSAGAVKAARRVFVRPIRQKREDDQGTWANSPYNPEKRSHVPVASFDGGGMRGLLAARVAEEVQSALSTAVNDRLQDPANWPNFEWQYEGDAYDKWRRVTDTDMLKDAELHVHMADVFDVCSGTSTGSILASFFATKGGKSLQSLANLRATLRDERDLVDELDSRLAPVEAKYRSLRQAASRMASGSSDRTEVEGRMAEARESVIDILYVFKGEKFGGDKDNERMWAVFSARQYEQFMKAKGRDPMEELPAGSAVAAQAMFVAYGKRIFERRSVLVAPTIQPPGFLQNLSGLYSVLESSDELLTDVERRLKNFAAKVWLPLKPDFSLASKLKGLVESLKSEMKLYDSQGAIYTLQQVLGAETRFSDPPSRGGLHTALVVPAFHVQQNRACIFWARPQPPEGATTAPTDSASVPDAAAYYRNYYGIVTVHRGAPPAGCASGAGLLADGGILQWPKPGQAAPDFTVRYHMGSASAVFPLDFKLWQAVRASTAAPTFFPGEVITATSFPQPGGTAKPVLEDAVFVDGGVIANDPMLEAMNCALMFRRNPAAMPAVLSIGTGTCESRFDLDKNQGFLLWMWSFATSILWNAMPETTTTGVLQLMNMLQPQAPNPAKGGGVPGPALRVQAQVLQPGTTSALESDLPAWGVLDESGRLGVIDRPVNTTECVSAEEMYWADVLQSMDVPENWDALLDIGAVVAGRYKSTIQDWVKQYIVM